MAQPEIGILLSIVHSEEVTRTSVLEVRSILSSLDIPTELVLHIMDIADYDTTLRTEHSDEVQIAAGGHYDTEACWAARLYLVSKPLPRSPEDEFWRVKKVMWELEGHDQGWTTDHLQGDYETACSWYDVCIFRPIQTDEVKDVLNLTEIDRTFRDPKRGMLEVQELLNSAGWTMVPHGNDFVWRLQNNCIARKEYERHAFEWTVDQHGVAADAKSHGSYDGDGFVEALQPGDRIGMWMRAKYRGWKCCTRTAVVTITYEFR